MQVNQILFLLGVVTVLAIVGIGVAMVQASSEKKKFFIYRGRYVQIINSLHSITTVANQLSSFMKELSNKEALDVFESALTSLKEILVAVREIPPFGKNISHLNEAFIISQANYQDFLRVQNLFRSDLTGRLLTFSEFKGFSSRMALDGCYFCSKPTLDFNFVEAKIKIEGATKSVKSCVSCHQALKTTGKANILYFDHGGKLVHWKDLPTYRPLENFWELNRFSPKTRLRHLELV